VLNISEGADAAAVDALAAAAGADLLDLHSDAHHNRSVVTTVGEAAARRLARTAVERLDLRHHQGAHPRFGVVDVVPFVPLAGSTMTEAEAARDGFLAWAAAELSIPGFAYGRHRTLPEVRRRAFADLAPDAGPSRPHPRAGAIAVGAREVLVAWNLWLAEPDLARAREVARAVRGPHVRALGLAVGPRVQVSMNLIAPLAVGPADAWDLVSALVPVADAELVGLAPESVLVRTPEERWEQLDLSPDRTIEARLARRGA
jgi:glutamate formiminotransferase / 5-formyltetrahydrofolate cyclo-ligase